MIPKILSKSEADEISSCIDEAEHVVIVCHVAPDGDAIGSSLALWYTLTDLGKDAYVIVPDQYPASLRFLKGCKDILVYTRYTDFAQKLIERADLFSVWISMSRNGSIRWSRF